MAVTEAVFEPPSRRGLLSRPSRGGTSERGMAGLAKRGCVETGWLMSRGLRPSAWSARRPLISLRIWLISADQPAEGPASCLSAQSINLFLALESFSGAAGYSLEVTQSVLGPGELSSVRT